MYVEGALARAHAGRRGGEEPPDCRWKDSALYKQLCLYCSRAVRTQASNQCSEGGQWLAAHTGHRGPKVKLDHISRIEHHHSPILEMGVGKPSIYAAGGLPRMSPGVAVSRLGSVAVWGRHEVHAFIGVQ